MTTEEIILEPWAQECVDILLADLGGCPKEGERPLIPVDKESLASAMFIPNEKMEILKIRALSGEFLCAEAPPVKMLHDMFRKYGSIAWVKK